MTNIYCGVSDVPAKQRRGTQKECIEKNIPEEQAVEKLIELIKLNGDYIEI